MQCSGFACRDVGMSECRDYAMLTPTCVSTQGSLNQYGIQKETNSDGTTRQISKTLKRVTICMRQEFYAYCVFYASLTRDYTAR